MTRRKFSREFKVEAVRLVTERGVAVAQAARDLDVAESVSAAGYGTEGLTAIGSKEGPTPQPLPQRFPGTGRCGPTWPRSPRLRRRSRGFGRSVTS